VIYFVSHAEHWFSSAFLACVIMPFIAVIADMEMERW
jgi:hypothetical protein